MRTAVLLTVLLAGIHWAFGAAAEGRCCEAAAAQENYKFSIEYHSPDGDAIDIEFMANSQQLFTELAICSAAQ